MNDTTVLFGQRLRELRERRSVSQEKLAARAGLNRTYISKIERGQRNITLDTITRLAEALECPITELFTNFKSKSNDGLT